ncbi:signal recognition particle 19 kDa protein [Talaromyces pinophilus]|uniref:Signal recognition particle 19 kDa protein n=1 Tax=Talaromyces pinophilus TaxID=128442 RepID=A0A6V8H212_TALPI|nr:signal recognition particle 19 kDa protein [Talaromyces pinophilus]
MSRHAQVEELSDSDPEEVAPSDDVLPADHIISPSIMHPSPPPAETGMDMPPPGMAARPQPRPPQEIPKHFHCLYAVYFDKTLRVEGGFEPEKLHPKDWANPGRVRVLLKDEDGNLLNPRVKNKHHLQTLVAQFLQAHPTDEKSPFRLRIHGLPMPDKLPDAPAAPRGWKIGKILPIHSPAYSGGGVSDNPFKDAMAEMEKLGGMPGMPGMPGLPGMPPGLMGMGEPSGGAEPKKKKEKKKGKA